MSKFFFSLRHYSYLLVLIKIVLPIIFSVKNMSLHGLEIVKAYPIFLNEKNIFWIFIIIIFSLRLFLIEVGPTKFCKECKNLWKLMNRTFFNLWNKRKKNCNIKKKGWKNVVTRWYRLGKGRNAYLHLSWFRDKGGCIFFEFYQIGNMTDCFYIKLKVLFLNVFSKYTSQILEKKRSGYNYVCSQDIRLFAY